MTCQNLSNSTWTSKLQRKRKHIRYLAPLHACNEKINLDRSCDHTMHLYDRFNKLHGWLSHLHTIIWWNSTLDAIRWNFTMLGNIRYEVNGTTRTGSIYNVFMSCPRWRLEDTLHVPSSLHTNEMKWRSDEERGSTCYLSEWVSRSPYYDPWVTKPLLDFY